MIIFLFLSFSLFAGTPTLKTINVDGNPSDWTEVLANPIQVTMDDDGSSMDPSLCSTLSQDRDCPVGTNGRDLNTFAWTFDNTYIYIYQTRYGSTSNTQEFWFYMDVGGDKLLGNEDFILRVSFKGQNSTTDVYLYRYSQNGTDPDPMVDENGYADGYTVIGTYGTQIRNYGNLRGGFSNGTGFETRVPWSDLGVPVGTGIYYHVGSSNSPNIPTQIDDNCGGPNGGIGTFGFYLVSVKPDNEGSTQSGSIKEYNHTMENTGTFDAIADFKVNSTLGLSVSLYDSFDTLIATDSNGDGDFDDLDDYLNSSFDTNSNNFPDTGTIGPGEEFGIILRITIPSSLNNTVDETTIYGWIEGEDADDSAIDRTYIGDIQIYPALDLTGMPSSTINFAHTILHFLAPDFVTIKVLETQSWSLSLYYDSNGDGTGDTLMATDLNGDGDFTDAGDYINPSFDTNSDNFPDTGTLNPGVEFNFVLSIDIPSDATYEIENIINCYAITSEINVGRQATLKDTLTVKPRFNFTPEYKDSEGNASYCPANFSVYFAHIIKNNSSSADIANLSFSSEYGTTVVFWSDPNCDGSISDGSIITNTGTIPGNGGEFCIIAEVQIPSGVPKGEIITTQITATSQNFPTYSISVIDEAKISMLVSYEDEIYSKTRTKFANCEIVYVKGFNFTPSSIFYLHYIKTEEKKNSTKVANGFGQFNDFYNFNQSDETGNWNINADDGSIPWDSINIILEPNGNTNSISPFATNKTNYSLSDNVTINATLQNTNTSGNYNNSLLKIVLLTLDENYYWNGLNFVTYNGTEWSKEISGLNVYHSSNLDLQSTINNVNFPSPGPYKIKANWEASCNYEIANAEIQILSGAILRTYTDETFSTETQEFYLHDPVYLSGNYHFYNQNIKITYYDRNGNLIGQSTTSTNGSGSFQYIQDTSSWETEGTVYAVVYLSSSTIPVIYTPSDPNILSNWNFNLTRLPGLLRNDQYPVLGDAIFKQKYPLDPALDPVNDIEKADFHSQDSFPNEYNDLLPTSSPIIFYELTSPTNNLRLIKSIDKIVISF